MHQLYPSRYSKNKYINEANAHKRAKKTHYQHFDNSTLNSPMSNHSLFNSKIIKKKHKKVYKKNVMNNSEDECSISSSADEEERDNTTNIKSTKYEKTLLSEGFKTLFQNLSKSDRNKNINIIVNLKKGKNNIYNNENGENGEHLYYQEVDEDEDEHENEDEDEEKKEN